MKRSHEQNTRRFLANCYKNDSRESRNERLKSGKIEFLTTRTFIISITNIDGPISDECCGIRVSFFNTVTKAFVGKSYATYIGDEEFMFHSPVDTTLVVYESVIQSHGDGAEKVSCWGYTSLSELGSTRRVSLTKGCARLLEVDKSVWPKSLGTSAANLYIEVTVPSDIVYLASLIPQCVGVPRSYAPDVIIDDFILHSFRIRVSKLVIRECMLPVSVTVSPFEHGGSWNCLVFAHNMQMILSYCTEMNLSLDMDGNLVSMKEVEIQSLPKHKDTSLVIAVRFKGAKEGRFRTIGYCVFNLLTDIPKFCDCDVNVRNLPFLKGPFSCEDPRCTNLESNDRYAMLPMMGDIKVGYYETLILGERVERYDANGYPVRSPEGAAYRKELRASNPLFDIPTPSDDGSLITVLHEDVQDDLKKDVHEDVKKDIIPPKYQEKPDVDGLNLVTVRDGSTGIPSSQTNIYKMLCDIMDEVKAIRRGQQQIEQDMVYEEHVDPDGNTTGRYVRRDPLEKNVLSLNRVRKALDSKRRLAINENLRPLLHPKTGERLLASDVLDLPNDLPNNQYMIRFEGITLAGSAGNFQLPKKLVVHASYANLPMVQMGVMIPSKVYDADGHFSSSYSLSDMDTTSSTGYIWVEPKETAESAAFLEYKKTGTVYLHIYDATTSFYIVSADLKLNHFQRPSSSIFSCDSLDLIMYEDLSRTERTLPAKAPLILHANVGYLHITVASVGVPCVSHTAARSSALGGTTNMLQQTSGGKMVVVANKIRADFCADHTEEAEYVNGMNPLNGNHNRVMQTKETNLIDDPRVHLHTMRAQYVRKLLQDRTAAILAQQINGGTLPTVCASGHSAENEFKLRYVEKRRDEVKRTKISEALNARTTTHHHVCAWMGSPKIIDTLFVNPFPCTVQYLIEAPQGKGVGRHITLHPDTPSVFTLGPKQDKILRAVLRVLDHPISHECEERKFTTDLIVKTSKLETARKITFHVSVISPIIHRRYKIFAASDRKLTKRLYCRAFPPTHNAESLMGMCHQVTVSDGDLIAVTQAVVEPLTAVSVAAVEEVHISCEIRDVPRRFYLSLFKDSDFIDAFETWEIEINPCNMIETRSVPFGQTTILAIPIVCDQLYSAECTVEPFTHVDCSTLKVTPLLHGVTNTVLLHAVSNGGMGVQGAGSRYVLCDIPSVCPTPSYEDFIEVNLAMSSTPIFRRLQFKNQEQVQKMFHIFSTYKSNMRCTPEQFILAPQESIQIAIQIFNLNVFGGEGRWPMWIFLNDSENRTVDSYLIHVSVRNFVPITE